MFNAIWGREYNLFNEISLIKIGYNKFENKKTYIIMSQ